MLVSSRCDLLLCTFLALFKLFCMEIAITPCLLVTCQYKSGCSQCDVVQYWEAW